MEKPPQYPGPAPATTAPVPAALPASAAVAVRPLINLASEAAAVLCPASPFTESSSSYLGPGSALTAPDLASIHLESDLLIAVASATASTIQRAPYLNSFLAGNQRPTLSPPPTTANHPASPLLKAYAELCCRAYVVPVWPLNTILGAIATGPNVSTLTLGANGLFQQEMLERTQNGFSIILPVDMALLVFGDRICISCLASVKQANRKSRLICNSSAALDDVTPAVNASTYKYNAPKAIQFCAFLPWFLRKIWEADPSDGPMWFS